MEREMAILPTRQARVEAYHQRQEVHKKMKQLTSEMTEYDKAMSEIRRAHQIQSAWYTRHTAEYNGQPIPGWTLVYTHPEGGGREGKKVERAQFIMKCPDGECRGFLSSAYKCGTCQNWACPDCLVVKGKEKDTAHTCDPTLKETVALIIKDSKACPKCGERISKIDGCDQMWCVDCHTAFSWASGKVINGVIHNPHYYEFLRKQGGDAPRNAGDIPCGGIPHYYTLSQRVRGLSRVEQTELMNIHRIVSEVSDQRAAQYQGQFTQEDNGDLGVKYLLREITRDQMKAELSKREIKRSKQMAIRAVLEMFALTGAEILQRVVAHEGAITTKEVQPILGELRALRIYVNESLQQISRVKGCSVPQIGVLNVKGEGEPWKWIPFYKVSKALATAKKAAAKTAAASKKKEEVAVQPTTSSFKDTFSDTDSSSESE